MLSFLFYSSLIPAAAAQPLLYPLVKGDLRKRREREESLLAVQFGDALQSMKTAMRAGYAVENAIAEARKDLIPVYGEESLIAREFLRMRNEIRMQIPAEEAFREMGRRSGVREIMDFAVLFGTAKRSGGDLIAIMDNTAEVIREKTRTEQEILTSLAEKRIEWKVMTFVPLGIIVYMRVSFPAFSDVLYGSAAGAFVMTGALVCFGLAHLLGRRILRIEV